MDASAVHTDLKKALSLVAKKHGIHFSCDPAGATRDTIRFDVTLGEQINQDMREYLAVATPKMKAGHNQFKLTKRGLCDEMLGKRFRVEGKQLVYLGCMTSRPAYPVSVLEVRHGSYRQMKWHVSVLDRMIAQHELHAGKQRQQEVETQLKQVSPELAEEANFS